MNLFDIIKSIIAVVITAVGVYLTPAAKKVIEKKVEEIAANIFSGKKGKLLEDIYGIAVKVEQFTTSTGAQKKAMVESEAIKLAKSYDLTLTNTEIDSLIEQSVALLKKNGLEKTTDKAEIAKIQEVESAAAKVATEATSAVSDASSAASAAGINIDSIASAVADKINNSAASTNSEG